MSSTLYRSARHISQADVQALGEFLRTTEGAETQLHRLLKAHPAIIGALGFVEFLSEFPLAKRGEDNAPLEDVHRRDRADILAAKLAVAANLSAKKLANVVELKGASTRVLEGNTRRRSRPLDQAVNQLRDYTTWLTEVPENRQALSRFGWDVWRPTKTIVMGSMSEFAQPGRLEQVKQELLESDGVMLILADELLALIEEARLRSSASVNDGPYLEGLVGLTRDARLAAPLVLATGGLGGLLLARQRLSENATPYGNVDVRSGVPIGLVHVDEPRIQPLARRLQIPFAEALVGFSKYRRWYRAEKSGIVVADFDADALEAALQFREQRNAPRREKARTRRFEKRTAAATQTARRFAEAVLRMFPRLEAPTALEIAERATVAGRVGANSALRLDEAVWLAVAAHAAYEHLGLRGRDMADQYRDRVREVLAGWGGPDPAQVLRADLPPAPSSPRISRRGWRMGMEDEDEYYD
jgi:hypothetical protein